MEVKWKLNDFFLKLNEVKWKLNVVLASLECVQYLIVRLCISVIVATVDPDMMLTMYQLFCVCPFCL